MVVLEVVFIPSTGGVSKPHSKDITPTHIHTLTRAICLNKFFGKYFRNLLFQGKPNCIDFFYSALFCYVFSVAVCGFENRL